MKMFRLKALIPILLFVGMVLGISYFCVDTWIKNAAISLGQKYAEAKVEIAHAHLQFSPFGVTFQGVSVADKNAPLTNLFQLETITCQIDLSALLRKNVCIETIEATGLEIGTSRTTSGALTHETPKTASPTTDKEAGSTGIAITDAIKKIDVTALIDTQAFEIDRARKNYIETLDRAKTQLNKAKDTEHYKKQTQSISDNIKELSQFRPQDLTDMARIQDTLTTLQKLNQELSTMKRTLYNQQELLKRQYVYLSNGTEEVLRAAQKDYSKLEQLIQAGDVKNQSNLTQLLSPTLQAHLAKANRVLNFLKAFSKTGEGQKQNEAPQESTDIGYEISFLSPQAEPRFWLKKAVFSGAQKQMQLTHLSSDQARSKHPTQVDYTDGPLSVTFVADYVNEPTQETIQFRTSTTLKDIEVARINNTPIQLANTEIGVDARLSRNNAQQFLGLIEWNMRKTEFVKSGLKPDLKFILSRLETVPQLEISIAYQAGQPTFQSNIDDAIRSGFDILQNDRVAEAKKALKNGLEGRATQSVSQLKGELKGYFDQTEKGLSDELSHVTSLETSLETERKKFQQYQSFYQAKLDEEKRKAQEKLQQEATKALNAALKKVR